MQQAKEIIDSCTKLYMRKLGKHFSAATVEIASGLLEGAFTRKITRDDSNDDQVRKEHIIED